MTREELIEVMARAMLADELTVRPTLTFDPAWQQESDIWLSNAKAALAAIEAAGVRLVPVEPSRQMLIAAHMVERDDIELTEDEHRAMYAAFVAASPYALKETGQ